jgi:hypothetical protein
MRTTKITAKRLRPLEPVSRAAKVIVALRQGSTVAERVRAITGLLREEAAAASESDRAALWVFYQTFEDDKPNVHHFQGACADVILHVLEDALAWTDCEGFCSDLVEQRDTVYDLFDVEKHAESSMCEIFMDAFWKGDGNGVSAALCTFHPEAVPGSGGVSADEDMETSRWLETLAAKAVDGAGASDGAGSGVAAARPTAAYLREQARVALCTEYLGSAVSSDVIKAMENCGITSMYQMIEWDWRDVCGIFKDSTVAERDQRVVYSMITAFASQHRVPA